MLAVVVTVGMMFLTSGIYCMISDVITAAVISWSTSLRCETWTGYNLALFLTWYAAT